MNRRGFALVAVLWMLTVASVAAVSAMTLARDSAMASRNRIALARGRWAGEACEAILRARFARDPAVSLVDTTDLGRGTWCVAIFEDPDSRINLDFADQRILRRLLGSDSLVDALLDWSDPDTIPRRFGAEESWYRSQNRTLPRNGPITSLRELGLIRGFEGRVPALEQAVSVSPTGRLNLNVATSAALEGLGVFDGVTRAHIRALQSQGHILDGFDDLLRDLDQASQTRLSQQSASLARQVGFRSERLFIHISGGVHGMPAVWHTAVEVVPSGRRLAVMSRVIE